MVAASPSSRGLRQSGEAHHCGAWTVAYADFVTAMMACFLLLWLLNAVTEEQLNGIADYFTPIAASTPESGAGGMLGGQTLGEGASQSRTGQASAVVLPPPSISSGGEDNSDPAEGQKNSEDDQDRIDMFAPGSANLYPRAKKLLAQIAKVIKKLPNKVSIAGHTEPSGYVYPTGYTNWELSSDRALATRHALIEGTMEDNQIQKVQGVADREPIDPQTPRSPRNRRVPIVVLKSENVNTAEFDRLPRFLERANQPAPVQKDIGERLRSRQPGV